MKKKLFKLVSLILTIALLSQALCLQMFADGKGYISELRLSWNSKSAEGAKQWLWDNGYDVIDCDLNGGTNGRPWVYLGYKTTDNPDEAITDIKIMNMNGGFVSFDTQEELRKMYSELFHDGENLMVAVNEFRENYYAGGAHAATALQMLNMFYLDNDVPLGDFILNSATVEDMIELRYMAAAMPSQTLLSLLSIGITVSDDKFWVDKLAEKLSPTELEEEILEEETLEETTEPESSEEDITDETTAESAEETLDTTAEEATAEAVAEATEAATEEAVTTEETVAISYNEPAFTIATAYSARDIDASYDIYDLVQVFQELYADYRSSSDRELVERCNTMFDSMRAKTLATGITLFDYLMDIQVPTDVLPMAASMTDGQIVMARQQGVPFFAAKSISSDDLTFMLTEANSIGARAYYWEGREEIDYENGFALTMDAVANMELSESTVNPTQCYTTLAVIFGALSVVALACAIYSIVQMILVHVAAKTSGITIAALLKAAMDAIAFGEALTLAFSYTSGVSAEAVLLFCDGAFRVGLIVSGIAFVVLAALTALFIYLAVDSFYNPDFTDIPWTMADMFTSREGVSNLIYYKAVLDDEGVAGDLNAWKGNSWNALYTTKDKRVGNPITADMLAITDQPEAPQGYLPVTHFGKVVAQNTNVGTYATNKKHYIFFRNTDPSFSGSVFGSTNGGLIFGGTGLVVGAALGAIGVHFISKRKKQTI